MTKLAVWAVALTLSVAGTAHAQVLDKEPGRGELRAGQKVLVESRKCPKGQVMEISGGSNMNVGTRLQGSSAQRERRCVPRP